MGGFGSGGWNSKGRPVVEHCFSLEISCLGIPQLLKKNKCDFWIGILGVSAQIELISSDMLKILWAPGTRLSCYQQLIGFQWLAHKRHFGGYQYYFVCGGCNSPRTKLLLYQNYFACRCCHDLGYASQRQNSKVRDISKLCGQLDL